MDGCFNRPTGFSIGYYMKETEIEQWVGLKQGGDVYKRYKVSSLGRVYDLKNDTYVSPSLRGKPQYYYVNLVNDKGDRKGRRIHNIMGWSFLGDRPKKGDTIDHIDRNKYNNSLCNLRWLGKSGQMENRNERTNTTTYFIGKNYNPEEFNKSYNYITELCRVTEYTLEEASNIYKLRVKYDTTSQPLIINGRITILEELCDVFNRDITDIKMLLSNSIPLEECFYRYHRVAIKKGKFELSLEFDGVWYPNKLKLSSHLNLSMLSVNEMLTFDNLKDYNKFLKYKEQRKQFTIQLRQDRLHGQDWGDNIFGTIRGIARRYDIPDGTLWHRVQKVGYTMKEALALPKGNIDQYWKLGINYHLKSEVCFMVELNQHNITQRINKNSCPLMYAIIPENIKCNDKSRIFILNGNALWYNDLKHNLGVESTLSSKSVLKKYQSIREWLVSIDAINSYDNFEEVVF